MTALRWGVAAVLMAATVASAQGGGRGAGRRGGNDSTRPVAAPKAQRAARLAIERLVRTQVRPTEVQLRQIQAVDARYETQRVQLLREEQGVRQQLRQLMIDTANVDQGRIEQVHDRLVKFPGRRAALLEAEQRELATFLSPLQRARYHAIQEQVRRQIEQRGRAGPPPGPPPAP